MSEQDQYTNVCKERFDEILKAIGEVKASQNEQNKRLFIDNGAECQQSKINRHDGWIKRVMIVVGAVATGLFGLALWVLKMYLTKSI